MRGIEKALVSSMDTLCPTQLILDGDGLSRVAQTVQALLDLPVSGPRHSSRQDAAAPTVLPQQLPA